MPLITYGTEYEEDDVVWTHDFGTDLHKARAHARYLTRKSLDRLVYVIAFTGAHRVGGECYYNGRLDHADGVIKA